MGTAAMLLSVLLGGVFAAMAVERYAIFWMSHTWMSHTRGGLTPSGKGSSRWRDALCSAISTSSSISTFSSISICATLSVLALGLIPASEQALLASDNGLAFWGVSLTLVTIASGALHYPMSGNESSKRAHLLAFLITLSGVLVSGPVLLAAAAPSGSLQLIEIVGGQQGHWTALWQPLGLALMLALAVCVNTAIRRGLGGSSAARQFLRYCLLLSFSAMAATIFLGGFAGGSIPGWLCLLAKTLIVMMTICMLSHAIRAVALKHLLAFIWLAAFPFASIHLVVASLMPL